MSLITRIERKLNEGEIPSRAWHSASLGWYHLRVGERERAKRHFQRAISLLSNEGDFIEEAETHFGMTLVHLLEADPAAAAQEYQRAGTLSPVQYPLASAEAPVLARLNGRDLSHLRNNPNMQTSMSDFVARLRAMASAQ